MASTEARPEAVPDAEPAADPSPAPAAASQTYTPKKSPWFVWVIFNLPLVAIATAFPSKNLVSRHETTFVGFTVFYIFFLSHVLAGSYSGKFSPRVLEPNKLLAVYIFMGTAMLGFVLPLGYFGYAYFRQIPDGMHAIAPLLYLLSCQLFTQYVANGLCFCLPARALVSVVYNARIIFAAYEWYGVVGGSEKWLRPAGDEQGGALDTSDLVWVYAGKFLAMANLVYWIFNLFGFLLPIYLPRAFKKHYDLERAARKKKQ